MRILSFVVLLVVFVFCYRQIFHADTVKQSDGYPNIDYSKEVCI